MDSDLELDAVESTAITFEWTVRNVKSLFESSSEGKNKSKVTRSPRFAGEKWQVLFYANAGGDSGEFVSLYLSCEPTPSEKEIAPDGRWAREGVVKFSFELRKPDSGKTLLFHAKEAHNHTFCFETPNWGWTQFAKRDKIYYSSPVVREADSFIVLCTITAPWVPPAPPAAIPARSVPALLVTTIGDLLDDPLYSDVEFVFSRPGKPIEEAKRIYAARKLLERGEYFKNMFNTGFSESVASGLTVNTQTSTRVRSGYAPLPSTQDSDEEDEDEDEYSDAFSHSQLLFSSTLPEEQHSDPEDVPAVNSVSSLMTMIEVAQEASMDGSHVDQRAVPSTLPQPQPLPPPQPPRSSSPKRSIVMVRDATHTTYRAVLYYMYTDMIAFAPLASSFIVPTSKRPTQALQPTSPHLESPLIVGVNKKSKGSSFDNSQSGESSSRKAWIHEWMKNNPSRPTPCSAKAVYRLADEMDLRELKERAFQFIIRSLTVDNIAHEAFSSFSATFDDVRKVQIDFFLANWSSIRSSDGMRNVWKQIRDGQHPGFEEVWPVIASRLDFKPQTDED